MFDSCWPRSRVSLVSKISTRCKFQRGGENFSPPGKYICGGVVNEFRRGSSGPRACLTTNQPVVACSSLAGTFKPCFLNKSGSPSATASSAISALVIPVFFTSVLIASSEDGRGRNGRGLVATPYFGGLAITVYRIQHTVYPCQGQNFRGGHRCLFRIQYPPCQRTGIAKETNFNSSCPPKSLRGGTR